jgi:hypothetical protein
MSKGWDRASFDFNTRPDKMVRDISQQDLMVPTVIGGSRLHLAGICAACGLLLSLLWVWTTLMILSVVGIGPGGWFYPIVAAAAVVFACALYVFSTWDFGRQERWGREA